MEPTRSARWRQPLRELSPVSLQMFGIVVKAIFLAPLLGAVRFSAWSGGVARAQPPANFWQPFRLRRQLHLNDNFSTHIPNKLRLLPRCRYKYSGGSLAGLAVLWVTFSITGCSIANRIEWRRCSETPLRVSGGCRAAGVGIFRICRP